MLTIFSCPKPFRGHIDIIQRNAIKSWTLLQPRPEVILMGNEEGTADVCKEFGIRHIPGLELSEYGTPLVNSIFQNAQDAASHPVMCYVNSDIIFMSDLMGAIQLVTMQNASFLLVGCRWDIWIVEHLSFIPEWENNLKDLVKRDGKLHGPNGIDYFIFPKGFFMEILPFVIGRLAWDWWLIWYARSRKAPVVDSTPINVVIHQNHDYSHIINQEEIERNKKLFEKNWWPYHACNLLDCTHMLSEKRVERVPLIKRLDPWILRLKICIYRDLKKTFPYSYPVYFLGKTILIFVSLIIGLLRKMF